MSNRKPKAVKAFDPSNPPSEPDDPTVAPDLSMIAKGLQSLVIRCDSIDVDPANVRKHPTENLEAIRASLRVYGQRKPIVVNRRTNTVEAGNGTLEAARALGWMHIAAVFVDDDPTTAAGFAIADNRSAELAEWNQEGLDALLRTLRSDDPELQRMLDGLAKECVFAEPITGLTDPDDVPEPPDEATTKPNDLWILGNHRLLCADSSKPEDVDRLVDGQPIHLVNTDPPYNVKVEPRSNNAIAAGLSSFPADAKPHYHGFDLARDAQKGKATHKKLRAKDRPLANDFVSDDEFDRLLAAWFGNMARVLLPGRGFYIWGGYANCGNYPPVLKAKGLYFSQAIIWVKEHPVLTRKDFMGNHEWCFYGWREGAAHQFFGPNNATDVWPIKKINPQSMIHLTEKPVALAARAMEYSSKQGEHVLDLFGGSGSTLIAAEQLRRRAFLMELDPLYCDVIVQRFEKFTGQKAERISAEPVEANV
jgi:DNA modification methylase